MASSELRLTAEVARDLLNARQEAFDSTLAIIRGMVDSQIQDAARAGRGSVRFAVPTTVFGREPFDLAKMGTALAKQLYADNFTVTGTCKELTVSWLHNRPQQKPQPKKQGAVVNVPRPKPR